MEELIKEIEKSLKTRKNGKEYKCYDWNLKEYKNKKCECTRGIGTKAYTMRRINLLEDKLKELKKDLINGKYDFKED